jgi:LysR family nitrogen assimilation transcriptional regulator
MTPLMRPNDHQIRLFLVVARALSLRTAASKLGITQSALSKQMRSLEAELQAPLFRRDGRGMQLTPLGQQLFQSMSHSYEQVDAAFEAASTTFARVQRGVSIAMVNTLATYLIPEVTEMLVKSHPNLRATLVTASSPEVVERVERGYSEIGLVYDLAVDTDAFFVERLHKELLSGYQKRRTGVAANYTAKELAAQPLILPPRPYALRRAVERELGAGLQIAVECNSVTLSLDLAARGLGIAVLPHDLPAVMVANRGLERVEILGGTLRRPVVAICRKADRMTESVSVTMAAVLSCVNALAKLDG